jgi:hypothetical protein
MSRFVRQWDCKVKIAVSIHAGRAVVGEVGSSEPPIVMAIGDAVDAGLRYLVRTRPSPSPYPHHHRHDLFSWTPLSERSQHAAWQRIGILRRSK